MTIVKHFCLPVCLVLLFVAGCGRNQSQQLTGTASSDSTYASPAPRHGGVEASFLDVQIKRGEEVQQELEKLRHAQPRDNQRVRALLVKRKGEILNAKKMIRESGNLSDTQKELMLSKLDAESIDLAQELVAVSQ